MPRHRSTALITSAFIVVGAAPRVDANGTDLVVVKRQQLGVISTPPAPEMDEYPAAGAATFDNGLGSFQVQTYRLPGTNEEQIQFLFTITDGSPNNDDRILIHFDVDHSHSNTAADRAVVVFRQVGPNNVSVGGLSPGNNPSSPVALPAAQWSLTSGGAGWSAEVKLTTADLGFASIPDLVGMQVQAINVPNAGLPTFGNYPNGVNPNTIASWANVKTRYPVDYMVVLDQSGSMLNQQKWQNAKAATNFFANTMAILGNQAEFNDRIGLVAFSWLCSGGNQTAHKDPGNPLAAVPPFPVGNYTDAPPALADPISNFCTPIGEGLTLAFSTLSANTATDVATRQRGVLLLSDGLQNRPGGTFTPGSTGYDPCGLVAGWNPCAPGTVSNVPVSTVAFGDGDWQVDTDLLNDIKGRYLGAFATTYDLMSNPDDLKEAFVNSLEEFYMTNQVYTGILADFPVVGGNDKLVAIASWNAGGAENIKFERNGTPVSCSPAGSSNAAVGLAICATDNPQGGTWRVVADDGSFGTNPTRIFVLVDLRLRARFRVDPVQPSTGDSLLLTAELTDRGKPVLHDGAHPVQVSVRVERPGQGVGTFAATHDPKSCAVLQPTLPPVIVDPRFSVGGQQGGLLFPPSSFVQPTATSPSSPDPQPPLFSLMTTLLGACKLNGLQRAGETLQLRDDGTQGDLTANDGIYSVRYTAANIEGTYVFRFNVTGTTADGEAFSRTKRQATYVRVKVDADASDIGSRVLSQAGNTTVREYFILPRDVGGEYFGPGRPYKVNFRLQGNGSFVGDVVDYGNGYYSRRVQYNPTQGEPVVTPEVNGQPLVAGGERPFEAGAFVSFTGFDNALGLDNGIGLGARLGRRVAGSFVIELEGDVTSTDDASGRSARAITLFTNLRMDLARIPVGGGTLVPFATTGMGAVWLRQTGNDEQAAAFHWGGGANFWVRPALGVRMDLRALYFGDLRGAGTTLNSRMTIGFVVRF